MRLVVLFSGSIWKVVSLILTTVKEHTLTYTHLVSPKNVTSLCKAKPSMLL